MNNTIERFIEVRTSAQSTQSASLSARRFVLNYNHFRNGLSQRIAVDIVIRLAHLNVVIPEELLNYLTHDEIKVLYKYGAKAMKIWFTRITPDTLDLVRVESAPDNLRLNDSTFTLSYNALRRLIHECLKEQTAYVIMGGKI